MDVRIELCPFFRFLSKPRPLQTNWMRGRGERSLWCGMVDMSVFVIFLTRVPCPLRVVMSGGASSLFSTAPYTSSHCPPSSVVILTAAGVVEVDANGLSKTFKRP